MIEVSTIEENLDKINAVYGFIRLLEVHYSVSKDRFLPDIRNAKEHLNNAIILWAKDIENKVLNNQNDHNSVPKITDDINLCLKFLDDFLKEKKLKNIESLELELKEFMIFLQEYATKESYDPSIKNKHDLKTLKSKILFLIS